MMTVTSEISSQWQFSHLNLFILDPLNNHWKHWDICEVSLDTFDQHFDGGDIDVDVKKHRTPDDGDGDDDVNLYDYHPDDGDNDGDGDDDVNLYDNHPTAMFSLKFDFESSQLFHTATNLLNNHHPNDNSDYQNLIIIIIPRQCPFL